MFLNIFKALLIIIFSFVRIIIGIVKIILGTIKIIYNVIYFILNSYVGFFRYLYRRGFSDLFFILEIIAMILFILFKIYLPRVIRLVVRFIVLIKDFFRILPFLFKRPVIFTEYNMRLSVRHKLKQKSRRNIIIFLYVFFIFSVVLFFYDIADEEQFLFMYDFHKRW